MNVTKAYTFDDLLIMPSVFSDVKSRKLVDTKTPVSLTRLPIISASMAVFDTLEDGSLSTTFAHAMAEAGGMHIFSRSNSLEDRIAGAMEVSAHWGDNTVGIAVGLEDFNSRRSLLETVPFTVSIDIANGALIDRVKWGGKHPLIIGNFANPIAPLRGDVNVHYKMGIGGGAACTTRTKTGVGAPQAWLIGETYKNVTSDNDLIISDGGIRKPADFVKAIALGADYVMLGSVLGGVNEAPRKVRYPDGHSGNAYKPFYGMASSQASGTNVNVEGISGFVTATNKTLLTTMNEYIEGLASAMTYVGADNITDFRQSIQWIETTPTVSIENSTALK